MGLHAKLAQVMYEAERIPKRGQAPPEMGGYPFVQVGDAADHIRKALAEKVVSMVPETVEIVDRSEHTTKSGGTLTTVEVRVTWRLTDGESGESATIQSYGAGADVGDKYSGKAQTSAMKYALLMGFLLSTGEDSEADALPERQARPARRAPVRAEPPPRVVEPPAEQPTDEEPPDTGRLPEEPEFLRTTTDAPAEGACPEHGLPWLGAAGDRYHRRPEGGYHRHPANTRRVR